MIQLYYNLASVPQCFINLCRVMDKGIKDYGGTVTTIADPFWAGPLNILRLPLLPGYHLG